ncbi:hypothetical protein WME98_41775 [Sorangium sp. So ce296]|uniref:hypothetical protein n=1 Tax=Sorangium sp. So ce296 TaxID=3133296 RepID=UPI003F62E786
MIENVMGKCCSALACVVGLLASPAAWAQDPAPPPVDPGAAAAPAAPPATAPPVEPTATAGDAATGGQAAPATPAPGTTEPVGEPPPAPSQIPSWFRFDADNLGLQVWAGASHQLGPISLSSDIYLTTLGTAEFDIGPAFTFGPVTLNPMVGFAFNFVTQQPAALVAPQLFTYIDAKPVYFESWILGSFSSMFDETVQNYLYSRDFLLFYPTEDFGIGPHLELSVDLNEIVRATDDPTTAGVNEEDIDNTGLSSLQIGGVIGLNYGTGNKLLLYLGYETQKESQLNDKIAGRFTFIHNF